MKRWINASIGAPEAGIVAILILLVVLFQGINGNFLSLANVQGMLRGMAYPGIIAIGMMFCLLSGVIDLSVGATAALSSVVFAIAARDWGWGLVESGVMALGVGAVVGMINGWVVTRLKITPFIMTICMMYAVRGVASWISNGYTVYPLPDGFAKVGVAMPLGISWAFIIMIVFMVVGEWMLRGSVWGLCVRAVGSDREAAACTEVNVGRVHRSVFLLTGVVSAFAGIMVSLILNAGVATAGTGWELVAIAACAIGGVSLFGYEGSFFGLFCGLLVMQVIQNGIVIIGISSYAQNVVVGGILLVSMILEVRRRKFLNLESL